MATPAPSNAASQDTRAPSPGALVYTALTLHTLISAGTYLVAKRVMTELDPLTLVTSRFLLSSLVFCLILVVTPGPALPPRRLLGRLLWMGFLVGPLNQGFFFFGLDRSKPAHAALLYALTPMTVYLLTVARGDERVSRRAMAGIGLAFVGVLVLLLARGLKDVTGPLLGDLFILGAVVAWTFYTANGKALIAEHGAIRATAWTLIGAAVLMLPASPLIVDRARLAAASGTALWGVVYLALLTSVASYLMWYYALSKTQASKVTIFANLQPVATALAGWVLLGDPLRWEIAVGGVLVLVGVRLTQTA